MRRRKRTSSWGEGGGERGICGEVEGERRLSACVYSGTNGCKVTVGAQMRQCHFTQGRKDEEKREMGWAEQANGEKKREGKGGWSRCVNWT